jgi:hypothetical protein
MTSQIVINEVNIYMDASFVFREFNDYKLSRGDTLNTKVYTFCYTSVFILHFHNV